MDKAQKEREMWEGLITLYSSTQAVFLGNPNQQPLFSRKSYATCSCYCEFNKEGNSYKMLYNYCSVVAENYLTRAVCCSWG